MEQAVSAGNLAARNDGGMKQAVAIWNEYGQEAVDLIKETVAKGTTDAELALFLYTAKRTGLDPLLKQIHCVKRWNAKEGRETMAIQTGIDGYRLIATRTGELAGIDDAEFTEGEGLPATASVTVWRIVKGVRCAFKATARWKEYCQTTKEGAPMQMWRKMPYLMLGKCAESLALRKAFPAELSHIQTDDEMQQADNPAVVITAEAKAQVAESEQAVKEMFYKEKDTQPTPIHHYSEAAGGQAQPYSEAPAKAMPTDSYRPIASDRSADLAILKGEYDKRLSDAQTVKGASAVMNDALDTDLPKDWKDGFKIKFTARLKALQGKP